jgi:hypothetical protein
MAFLISPYRETPEHLMKKTGKKSRLTDGWVGLGFRKCTGGSVGIVFGGPSVKIVRCRRPPMKKEKRTKKNPGKILNSHPTFRVVCFLRLSAMRVGHATASRRSPAAGSGFFLYELVPSDDPFIWCLCETILFPAAICFCCFQRPFFLFHPKKKVSS